MGTVLLNIPSTEGVRKISPGEGESFDIAGAHLTWKVKGEDSAYAFSVCEQRLAPGDGVPLHSHAYPEVFYILHGVADFFRVVDGKEDWFRCETGSTIILPPNALHAFYNKTSEPCDAVVKADQELSFSALPPSEGMARVPQIGAQHNMYFAPHDVNADSNRNR
jgi:quercetin dioxygenase-like cupin family protein